MSDRLIVSLAAVPMLSGALLLIAFQRAPAIKAKAPKRAPTVLATQGSADPLVRQSRWVGVIVAGDSAELAAEQDGTVTDVWIEAGTRVKSDQSILQIDSTDATSAVGMADAELAQRSSEVARAAARFEEASSKLRRLKDGGSWIADHEIERAGAEVRMAEAELRAARSAVQMGRAKASMQRARAARFKLKAPFAGTLVSCDVDPGDSVRAGQVLARVMSDDRHVRFALPPGEHARGEVVVSDPLTGRSFMTRITSVKPEVDTSAQLVFVTAALPPDVARGGEWLPGTSVQVTLAEDAVELGPLPSAPGSKLP
jgi:RND family efflux transporter MFP subunit